MRRCGCWVWVWVKARKGREGAKGKGAKKARKSLGSEKPRRAKGEGLEHASHHVPIKLAILGVKLATSARELHPPG